MREPFHQKRSKQQMICHVGSIRLKEITFDVRRDRKKITGLKVKKKLSWNEIKDNKIRKIKIKKEEVMEDEIEEL